MVVLDIAKNLEISCQDEKGNKMKKMQGTFVKTVCFWWLDISVSDTVALVEVVIVYKIPFLFSFCRVNEDESGNITMKETGSKPLKRDDLDSDVSLTHT